MVNSIFVLTLQLTFIILNRSLGPRSKIDLSLGFIVISLKCEMYYSDTGPGFARVNRGLTYRRLMQKLEGESYQMDVQVKTYHMELLEKNITDHSYMKTTQKGRDLQLNMTIVLTS